MPEELVSAGSDLRAYLGILRRRKFVIAGTILVVLALTIAYVTVKRPLYTAAASVLVPQQSATEVLATQTNQQAPAAVNLQRNLTDDQLFAEGAAVKRAVKKALGYPATVTVSASSTADVLTFTTTSPDAARAANVANTYAHTYIAQQRSSQAAQYTGQVSSLEASLAQLRSRVANEGHSARAADNATIASLTQNLQDLQAAANLAGTTSGTILDSASVPTTPSSPKKVRDGILAVIVGLVLGTGLAFGADRLDDTIDSFVDIDEETGGLPVLGTIPLVASWRRRGKSHLAIQEDATSAASESYRTLRTAVQFLSLDEPKRVIGITSAVPNEGKTTTVANLALSFARAGQQVIVVSFDFRKPSLHAFFGLGNDSGVTTVLLGRESLKDAVKTVEAEPRLRVLPSGPIPPNPAEILALDHVVDLVDAISKAAQVVIIDCPPVLPVTDTLLISRVLDGMLILTRAGSTKKQDLRRTVELLRQVQAPILGAIVNSVPRRGGYAYKYGYGYGYGYRYKSKGTRQSDIADVLAGRDGAEMPSFDLGEDTGRASVAVGNGASGTKASQSNGTDLRQ